MIIDQFIWLWVVSDFAVCFKVRHVTGCTNHDSSRPILQASNPSSIWLQQKYLLLWGLNPWPPGRESSAITARPGNYFIAIEFIIHKNILFEEKMGTKFREPRWLLSTITNTFLNPCPVLNNNKKAKRRKKYQINEWKFQSKKSYFLTTGRLQTFWNSQCW